MYWFELRIDFRSSREAIGVSGGSWDLGWWCRSLISILLGSETGWCEILYCWTTLLSQTKKTSYWLYLAGLQNCWVYSASPDPAVVPWLCSCTAPEPLLPGRSFWIWPFPVVRCSYRNSNGPEGQELGRCTEHGRWASSFWLRTIWCLHGSPTKAVTEPLRKKQQK